MKRILIVLIVLSGVFNYKLVNETRFYPAQLAFFVFSAGLMGSYLLYQKNKWLGLIGGLCAFGFLKSFLLQHAPQSELFEATLAGTGVFGIYYAIRHLKLRKDILKFFLIPACLNIGLVIIQAFDHNFISFMPVDGITGFLGNKGPSACFIALTTPLFLKHFKKGLPFLVLAILLCKSTVAIGVFLISGLFYLWHTHKTKKAFSIILALSLIVVLFASIHYKKNLKEEVLYRASMFVGTLDGIMHNPVLGWGVGSFLPTISKIPMEDSIYCGRPFNHRPFGGMPEPLRSRRYIMNHPHNEVLFGWWNLGILYPILFIGLFVSLGRKFTKEKILSFSILVGGFACMMGYFLSYPTWFLVVVTLGIYENRGGSYGKEGKKTHKV